MSSSQVPSPADDAAKKRMAALTLAVLHHASSNLAERAVPPGWQTVVDTADGFLDYINTGNKPQQTRGRR